MRASYHVFSVIKKTSGFRRQSRRRGGASAMVLSGRCVPEKRDPAPPAVVDGRLTAISVKFDHPTDVIDSAFLRAPTPTTGAIDGKTFAIRELNSFDLFAWPWRGSCAFSSCRTATIGGHNVGSGFRGSTFFDHTQNRDAGGSVVSHIYIFFFRIRLQMVGVFFLNTRPIDLNVPLICVSRVKKKNKE